ncbi:hypothetical protein, partial [Mesorhizobium sp. M0088]|uniref:hypothetical protein n=1 Tax=Mesorhizobium sp. M0088 TaxID=2956873 RepID=UPI00333C3CB7
VRSCTRMSEADETVAGAGPSVWTSGASQNGATIGTQLASMVLSRAGQWRAILQYLNFNACKPATLL